MAQWDFAAPKTRSTVSSQSEGVWHLLSVQTRSLLLGPDCISFYETLYIWYPSSNCKSAEIGPQTFQTCTWDIPNLGFRHSKIGPQTFQTWTSDVPHMGLRYSKPGPQTFQNWPSVIPDLGFRHFNTGPQTFQNWASDIPNLDLRRSTHGPQIFQTWASGIPKLAFSHSGPGFQTFQHWASDVPKLGLRHSRSLYWQEGSGKLLEASMSCKTSWTPDLLHIGASLSGVWRALKANEHTNLTSCETGEKVTVVNSVHIEKVLWQLGRQYGWMPLCGSWTIFHITVVLCIHDE